MAPAATVDYPSRSVLSSSIYQSPSVIAPPCCPSISSSSKIKASVLHGPRDLRLEDKTIEPPASGELQIAIKSTGICGSDVSYYKKFANGDLLARECLCLGHESSGEVIGIGPDVRNFKIGDRVALEVGVPCTQCSLCRRGRYNLCKKMRFRSSAKSFPHYQGTLQEKINHPAKWCYRLPEHVSYDAAALLEPLSVAIHAVNRANPTPGSTVLVIGAGTVGLLTAAMARRAGCTTVIITDLDSGRVEYATRHGFATHGYVSERPLHTSSSTSSFSNGASGTTTPEESGTWTPASMSSYVSFQLDFAKALAGDILASAQPQLQLSTFDEDEEHEGVDVAFECTGKEMCMHTSLYATRPGGKVIMVGMGTPIQTLPMSVAHLREVDILGIFRYANTYETGIRLLCAQGQGGANWGIPSLANMVTHRFKGLGAAQQAFELASRTVDDSGGLVLKVVIEA